MAVGRVSAVPRMPRTRPPLVKMFFLGSVFVPACMMLGSLGVRPDMGLPFS